ncbi:MAG TPA: YifB family Mg chelatase-like AAA ATPase, partial [Gemmatimonadaceae bacterium]|nr:YifB family Mg chelatase-like AAA ATPase [Gemmatimonadaceae bacterium]
MNARVRSAAVDGVDATEVIVELDATMGLPCWTIVGLPASAVKESRERVNAALTNSGFTVPPRRMTVNLAPADTVKTGTAFDLPIALALLAATGQLPQRALDDLVIVGELGLDGAIRGVKGMLSIARYVSRLNNELLFVPRINLGEAGLVASLARANRLVSYSTFVELIGALRTGSFAPATIPALSQRTTPYDIDFADVLGQTSAKRALEVSAAGNHATLLVGPPGSGKTMLAQRIPTILPALSEEEALEVIAVQSVAGLLTPNTPLPPPRPFRAPHHTISYAGLVGGGARSPRPGEASLAHLGVLFLDELLEYSRRSLEALRQPLEDGRIVITRAQCSVTYPARFTLVGAANPCPCGHAGDPSTPCRCSMREVRRYRRRLSGPLIDRIDMHVFVGAIPVDMMGGSVASTESSAAIRERVEMARDMQRRRYGAVLANGQVSGRWLEASTRVDIEARAMLMRAATQYGFSARSYHRVLKVARTIADLAAEEAITRAAMA